MLLKPLCHFSIRTTPSRYSWKTAIQPSWCSWTEIMSLHIKSTTFTPKTSSNFFISQLWLSLTFSLCLQAVHCSFSIKGQVCHWGHRKCQASDHNQSQSATVTSHRLFKQIQQKVTHKQIMRVVIWVCKATVWVLRWVFALTSWSLFSTDPDYVWPLSLAPSVLGRSWPFGALLFPFLHLYSVLHTLSRMSHTDCFHGPGPRPPLVQTFHSSPRHLHVHRVEGFL